MTTNELDRLWDIEGHSYPRGTRDMLPSDGEGPLSDAWRMGYMAVKLLAAESK